QAIELTIELNVVNMPAFAWRTLALQPATQTLVPNAMVKAQPRLISNEWLKIGVEDDGSLTITNRETNKTYHQMLVFEDTGDMGNEYI
ncbi:MAG: hypothetical protein ACTIC7_13290, partial [Lactiplantibacillus plantarum]